MEKRLDDSDAYIVSLQEKIKALVTEKETLLQAKKALEEDKEQYQVMSCSHRKPLRKFAFFTSCDGGAAESFFLCSFCVTVSVSLLMRVCF